MGVKTCSNQQGPTHGLRVEHSLPLGYTYDAGCLLWFRRCGRATDHPDFRMPRLTAGGSVRLPLDFAIELALASQRCTSGVIGPEASSGISAINRPSSK